MKRLPVPWLTADPEAPFPPVHAALREPEGLLAVGGDLSPTRLLNAYRHGIFPWFSEGQPILWWSPDPRMVFDTGRFCLASRLRRSLKFSDWTLRADTNFAGVVGACAHAPRDGRQGTWITPDMLDAYVELHRLGHAHSIEVFEGDSLVGGIYGVAIGRMFFGESMFSARSGGSKIALAGLVRLLRGWEWPLIDAQVENPHLLSLGAKFLGRVAFMARVDRQTALPGQGGPWTQYLDGLPVRELSCKPLD